MVKNYTKMQSNDKIQPLTSGQSLFLDFTRFIAAQVVVVAHLLEWLYLPYVNSDHSAPNYYDWSDYFINKSEIMGAYAVSVFFVLSGFLISKSIFKSHYTTGFSLGEYILNRIARLLPTLLIAIAVSLLVYCIISIFDLFGHRSYILPDLSATFPRASADIKISTTVATTLFLNGMIGVPGINLGTINMNGPLWSLSHEFWFYICAGLMAHGFFNKKNWAIILSISFILWQIVFGNFIWVAGLFIWGLGAINPQIKLLNKSFIIGFLMFLLSLFILNKNYSLGLTLANKLLCGVSAFLLVSWGLSAFSEKNTRVPIIKKAASYSFTLYAIHWPLIVLFVGFFGPRFNTWSMPQKTLSYLLLFLGINIIAYIISKWSEDTIRWRNLLFRLKPENK